MKRLFITLTLVFIIASAFSQTEKKSVRRGNNAYEEGDFVESEVQYRKALEANSHSIKGKYNLSNSLYKQEKYEESSAVSSDINLSGLSDAQKAAVYHNRGNALFKQQKFKESAEAYKQSLLLNPKDIDTKYNMSEALRMLQQQQQQQNKDNQEKNKDQKDQDQNQDNNQDQNKKDEQKDNQDKKQDDQQQNQDQEKQQQQQPQEQNISKEDAERMLEAIQNNEKNVQDKMKEQKAKAAKVKVQKNW